MSAASSAICAAKLVSAGYASLTRPTLAEILGKAGVVSASERAKEIVLLVEGVNALILIHGDRSYADTAARAAKELLRRVERSPDS